MKRFFWMLLAGVLAALTANAVLAQAGPGHRKANLPLGYNPHPIIWGEQRPKPPQNQPVHNNFSAKNHHPSAGHHHGHGYPSCHASFPSYRSFYVYRGYYPYDYYFNYPVYYGGYLPPLWTSAENLFGPRAAMQVMGLGGAAQPQPIVPDWPAEPRVVAQEPNKGAQRATNEASNALAWRFIGFGDALFAEQKYGEANIRYRKAAQAAPQLADAWFRQGFALAATERYDLAVGVVKRGLRIEPDWAKSGFQLQELFGDDPQAVGVYLAELTKKAEAEPNNANLQFLLGVHLYFDNQVDLAQRYFDRAKALTGNGGRHIDTFCLNTSFSHRAP